MVEDLIRFAGALGAYAGFPVGLGPWCSDEGKVGESGYYVVSHVHAAAVDFYATVFGVEGVAEDAAYQPIEFEDFSVSHYVAAYGA